VKRVGTILPIDAPSVLRRAKGTKRGNGNVAGAY
jgi:hypothetical protein